MSKLFKIMAGLAFIAGGLALAPYAHAGVSDMCPGGHEGVAGGRTTIDFAENLRTAFLRIRHVACWQAG